MAKVHISKWWEKQNLHSYCYSDSIYIYKLIGLWVNQGLMKKIEIILYISNRSTLVEGYWFNCVWKVEKGEGEVIQRLGSTGRSQDYKNKKEEMVLRDPRKYSLSMVVMELTTAVAVAASPRTTDHSWACKSCRHWPVTHCPPARNYQGYWCS